MNKRASTKSEFLNDLFGIATELSDAVNDDGTPITNREQLLRLLWRNALGWVEKVRDDAGTEREVKHPPMSWAMELLLAMSVGKPTAMVQEQTTGIKAKDRVSDLARDRINAMAEAAMEKVAARASASPAVVKGPPKHRKPEAKGESHEQQQQ